MSGWEERKGVEAGLGWEGVGFFGLRVGGEGLCRVGDDGLVSLLTRPGMVRPLWQGVYGCRK